MMPDAGALRVQIYDWILGKGAVPTSDDLAATLNVSPDDIRRALGELKIGKTALVDPKTGELWMAGPFSAVPTAYRVVGKRASWFANCAWDMLGVAVIANERVRIEAQCTDCAAPMMLDVDPHRASFDLGVVHFLVPARHWYDDIGFT